MNKTLFLAGLLWLSALLPATAQRRAPPTRGLRLGFGPGVRANRGSDAVAMLEGRFLEIPGSAIQALEARATAALALGSPYTGQFLAGTVGPALGVLIPISGPLRGRGPFVGARFRRDTKTSGSVGLEIDFAPLQVTTSCSPPGCQPNAILFAPGYEAAVRPSCGRLCGPPGLLAADFPPQAPHTSRPRAHH